MNQVEQKAHDLAVQYTKDGEGNYDARCERACNEMADWKDREYQHKVLSALGCTECKTMNCEGCFYYEIKQQLL